MIRIALLTVLGFLAGCQTPPTTIEATSAELFQGPVRDLLEHRCLECHHHESPLGGLNFMDRDLVFKGDSLGPFVVSGEPAKSRMWKAIDSPKSHPRVMPGDGWGLTTNQRQAVLRWIETGAEWPTGKAGQLTRKAYRVDIEDGL